MPWMDDGDVESDEAHYPVVAEMLLRATEQDLGLDTGTLD